ncbi:MAG: sulfite exporter TauE/SafE family protein [Bacteroidetes bacterium]|nr:sulfite exporter TauE/SafE family protein [Bacteroidota bacterium]
MEIAGFIAAFFIGISLGLIGGGGSILTIPLLVYLFHIQPTIATGYSLFIVGISSLAGAFNSYRRGNIHFKAVLYFGVSSIITVVLIRRLLIPLIPEDLFKIESFEVTRSLLTMVLLALVMIMASFKMIFKPVPLNTNKVHTMPYGRAILRGIQIGILTGLLGAGGGFLIIPVLIFSFQIPMKKAIGSSLLIIALNALFGFISDVSQYEIHWRLLLIITVNAVLGTFIGNAIGLKLSGEKLKKGFGVFILLAGMYIILHELFLK